MDKRGFAQALKLQLETVYLKMFCQWRIKMHSRLLRWLFAPEIARLSWKRPFAVFCHK